jgi:aminoglycoside 3-N-acetyltransferase
MRPVGLTRSTLAAQLSELGVRRGGICMVHTRMRALGWVVGAAETVVRALLDALGPEGTLVAYASWDEHVYMDADRPAEHRADYRAEPPVFDVAVSEAARDHGRVPERIRTWPGACRSHHAEASVVALGPQAAWLTAEHRPGDGYGAASPFARLVEAGGQVLVLGAPLETITLLHHAEAIATAPGKRMVTFRVLEAEPGGGVVEREYTDIETSRGAYDYARLALPEDEFAVIANSALAAGIGRRGTVGASASYLFDAAPLVDFAVAWIEERFGRPG